MKEMVEEVANAPALYRPSRFWEFLGGLNEQMLSEHGLENLKRTVAQNYYNWLVVGTKDNQFRNAFRHWLSRPTLAPFFSSIEPLDFLKTIGKQRRLGWKEAQLYKLFVGFVWELAPRGRPDRAHANAGGAAGRQSDPDPAQGPAHLAGPRQLDPRGEHHARSAAGPGGRAEDRRRARDGRTRRTGP